MTTAQGGYTPVSRWVKQGLGDTHTTVVATVAWAVLCLLVAQRVTSAALAPVPCRLSRQAPAGRAYDGCDGGGMDRRSSRPRSVPR
jgi:hypothetical protein